jgi:transcription antitermination factor NusG
MEKRFMEAVEAGLESVPSEPEKVFYALLFLHNVSCHLGLVETAYEFKRRIGSMLPNVGDKIEVAKGPFLHLKGEIKEVNRDTGYVLVDVDIFGKGVETRLSLGEFRTVRDS